jgi:hypothetical protein
MTVDPQLALLIALTMAIGWTMMVSGLAKRMLEPKRPPRICPSCGREIAGFVCKQH